MNVKHNKDYILEVGRELFRLRGYANTGISDILNSAGIPKGTFYNFFQSKEDFAKQAMDSYTEYMRSVMRPILSDGTITPLERLKSFYKLIIDGNVGEGLIGGCMINNLSLEVGGQYESLGEKANTSFYGLIEMIQNVIEEGQSEDQIRDDFSPEELAEYLHLGFYGAMSRMKASRNADALNLFYRIAFDFLEK